MKNLIFKTNIDKKINANEFYRKILFTSKKMQVVIMTLRKNEYIPLNDKLHQTSFIKIEEGCGILTVGYRHKRSYTLNEGDSVVINPKTAYELINKSGRSLKILNILTPPQHDYDSILRRQPIFMSN